VTQAPKTLRTAAELTEARLVPAAATQALENVAARYAVAITAEMLALIDPSDPRDPIARQFVPDARELEQRPEELTDPIGDDRFAAMPGVVHRYADRVLLKLTHVCPVYCRFCFRRETVGPAGPPRFPAKHSTRRSPT
jgi:lysine 2,3-aminomutase